MDYSFLKNHFTKLKNYLKDNIEFVTEFPCLLGHPVQIVSEYSSTLKRS